MGELMSAGLGDGRGVKPSPRNGAADQTDGARFVTDGRMVEPSVPRMSVTGPGSSERRNA